MQSTLFTNKLEIKVYHQLPQYAIDIRNEVFVDEQGFQEEFDTDDGISTHLVGFINGKSVATARIIPQDNGQFIIGRVAVRKSHRNLGLGAKIIAEAEKVIASLNGKVIIKTRILLQSCRCADFVEVSGENTGFVILALYQSFLGYVWPFQHKHRFFHTDKNLMKGIVGKNTTVISAVPPTDITDIKFAVHSVINSL